MTFLARVAQFLFWLLVVSWSVALLRRLVAWMLRGAQGQTGAGPQEGAQTSSGRRLHRDPVCGTHVAEEIAFPLHAVGETLYFCSPECRDRYARSDQSGARKQRFAANS